MSDPKSSVKFTFCFIIAETTCFIMLFAVFGIANRGQWGPMVANGGQRGPMGPSNCKTSNSWRHRRPASFARCQCCSSSGSSVESAHHTVQFQPPGASATSSDPLTKDGRPARRYLISSQADQPAGRRSTHLRLSPSGCRPLLSGPPLV